MSTVWYDAAIQGTGYALWMLAFLFTIVAGVGSVAAVSTVCRYMALWAYRFLTSPSPAPEQEVPRLAPVNQGSGSAPPARDWPPKRKQAEK